MPAKPRWWRLGEMTEAVAKFHPEAFRLVFGERDRLRKDVGIADMVRQDESEPGIELGRLLLIQPAPGLHQGHEGGIWIRKPGLGDQFRHGTFRSPSELDVP